VNLIEIENDIIKRFKPALQRNRDVFMVHNPIAG